MQITDILKTAVTTIDGVITVVFLVGSVKYSKKQDQTTGIVFLALFALMLINAIMMWF